MKRGDGRAAGQMRPVSIKAGVSPWAEGSALCSFGLTQVLCTASVEPGPPAFAEARGMGWVTAEYAMLPRATHTRTSRERNRAGRAREISRLVGRSLRAAVDLFALAGHLVQVDCDVIVADGGTRTAAVTGGWVALAQALAGLGLRPAAQIAALSVGRLDGDLITDLCYQEDSAAEVDLNLVLAADGGLVEVQATAEQGLYTPRELADMVDMGVAASAGLFEAQLQALGED